MERNPVRAGLVRRAWRWPWSSAAAHCGKGERAREVLSLKPWVALGISGDEWKAELVARDDELISSRIRNATNTGRPLGGDSFVSKLEARLGRRLRPRAHGRPRK